MKGGKLNGVPYNFGKGGGTKGKGKIHKGLGIQPEHGEHAKVWWIVLLVLADRVQRSPILVSHKST